MPWYVGGGKWLKKQAKSFQRLAKPRPSTRPRARPTRPSRPVRRPRVERRVVYKHPRGYGRPVGFYKKDGKTRPITKPLPRQTVYQPTPTPPTSRIRERRPRPIRQVSTTKPRNTLANPVVRRSFMKWAKKNVNEDAYEKIDWDAEFGKDLTVSEAKTMLAKKHPEALETRKEQPKPSEIKEMIRQHEEDKEAYKEYVKAEDARERQAHKYGVSLGWPRMGI